MKRINIFILLCIVIVQTLFYPSNVYADSAIDFSWPINNEYVYDGNEKKYEPVTNQDYIELVYIESTGTQYIDTGVLNKYNTKTEIDCEWLSPTLGQHLIGNGNNAGENFRYDILINSSTQLSFRANDIGTYVSISIDITKNRHKYTLSSNGNILTYGIDDDIRTNSESYSYQDYNIHLFGDGFDASTYSNVKLYGCKIYYNNELIRNFIPVMTLKEFNSSSNADGINNIPANTPCLYDKQNGKYYLSKGTNGFVAGPLVKVLDDGNKYGILDYIESDGHQYIDTKVVNVNRNVLAVEMKYSNMTSIGELFGSFNSNTYGVSTNWASGFGLYSEASNNKFWIEYAANTPVSASSLKDGSIETIKLVGNTLYRNGSKIGTAGTGGLVINNSLFLLNGQCNNGNFSTANDLAALRLYYTKIWVDSSLVRDYIPVYSVTLGKYGLYDKLNDEFYPSIITSTGLDFKPGMSTNLYTIKDSSLDTTHATNPNNYNGVIELTDLGKYFFSASNLTHSWTIKPNSFVGPVHDATYTYDGQPHTVTVDSIIKDLLGADVTANAELKFSGDNGSTYTLDTPPTYLTTGTYTIYYQITPNGLSNYDTLTSTATLTIRNQQKSYTIPSTGIK